MQLPIIGIKKEASGGNAVSGICESGIGVQTAIQQCQPADGRLAAYAGPLVSHQQRNQERRRGDTAPRVLRGGGITSEFGFISVKTTDFNSVKFSSSGTADCRLRLPPSIPLRASLFPRVTPASSSSERSSSPFPSLNITGANQQTSDCTSFLKLSRITTISSWIITVNNPSH